MRGLGKFVPILFRVNKIHHVKVVTTSKLSKTSLGATDSSLISHPHTVKKLQTLFNVGKSTVFNIIVDHKRLTEVTPNEIDAVFKSCIEAGVTNDVIYKNIDILSASEVDEKIKLLRKLPYSLNVTLPFLLINEKILKKFLEQEISEKRIVFLSQLFEVKIKEVCSILSKRSFLLTLDLQHIQKCSELLKKYGITNKEICKDLWVLKYSVKNIEAKLMFATKNNIKYIKTWMVRVPTPVFENCIKRKSDNQLILGEKSFMEYISQKLQCSLDLAKYIISKHPAIQKKSLRKINEMVDFLLCKGFKPLHICRTPKILLHSVDTIKTRLKLLEDQGKQLNSLSVCTKSKKQFTNFLESIKSNNNKNK